MTPEVQIAIALLTFVGLLSFGLSVPFAIMAPATVYLLLQGGLPALKSIGLVSWGSMNSFTLTAIPLFILMAEILQRSGLSARVYRGLAQLVSRIPGGLLQTNIAGSAVFSAISGSSIATAATIGGVALPQLLARGYDRKMSVGSLAAGGTLGNLIPPGIAFIIYGAFTDTSVAKLFMAGVIPGLVLTLLYMTYIAVWALANPRIAPQERYIQSLAATLHALSDVAPFVVLILATIGTMYMGWVTPTEAAAIGCIFAVIVSAIWGKVDAEVLLASLRNTTLTVGNILFIVYAAFVFSFAISFAGVGEKLTAYVVSLDLSRWEFFAVLFVLFTVMGCLVEALGMIVITVPLLFPILIKYGIDPIWFGVVLVLFIELGAISPPIGINLFVIQSLWDGKLSEVVLGTIPFHILGFVLLGLLVIWPELALWLPSRMTN